MPPWAASMRNCVVLLGWVTVRVMKRKRLCLFIPAPLVGSAEGRCANLPNPMRWRRCACELANTRCCIGHVYMKSNQGVLFVGVFPCLTLLLCAYVNSTQCNDCVCTVQNWLVLCVFVLLQSRSFLFEFDSIVWACMSVRLCVCAWVYVCVCIYACVCELDTCCICFCAHTIFGQLMKVCHTHLFTHKHTHTHTHSHWFAHIHTHTHTDTHAHTRTYTLKCAHTHKHTHTRTQTHKFEGSLLHVTTA